ncbi:DUF1266 domain-containing protein [Streptomyces sp. NPDC091272]|uniref:DUF1266 domain-containing protein n=1 Tax=Streptomyces sp. NPDC091272 TaxID=3365981 RepID=UPI0038033CB3
MITGAGTEQETGTGSTGAGRAALPPTEIERRLHAAHEPARDGGSGAGPGGEGRRANAKEGRNGAARTDAVLDVLSGTRLYLLVPRLYADTPGYAPPLPTHRDPVTGRTCVPVLTPGVLPPWHPEWVFRQITLGELARIWPDNGWQLAVNLGTRFAVTLDARPKHRKAWEDACARTGAQLGGRLLTHSGGPLHGPLAHGLALGAQLAVHNGLVWNQLGAAYEDYATDIARLRSPWGVHNRADYRETLDALLTTRLVGRVQESVLHTRRRLVRRLGRTPSYQEWSAAVSSTLHAHDASAAELAEADNTLRAVVRYEERFRADGALAPEGRVDTLAAFDLGRAVNVVRLALGARYITPPEAEQAVLTLGEAARTAYTSWAGFSLGYALTRVLHFDQDGAEIAERKYQESLAQHRILTQDPTSPYRNIPWS